MSRPQSQSHIQYPPPQPLQLSPPPSQSGAGADISHAYPNAYSYQQPQQGGQGGYDTPSQRLADNRFLVGTLILGLAAWITCLVSQALVTHDESNTPIGTLWFALILQLYLLYSITLPSARKHWLPTPSPTQTLPVTTSQIPSSPPTLPPIVINHTPGSTLRAFSIRSGSARSKSPFGFRSGGGDKEKGGIVEERRSIPLALTPGEGPSKSGLLSPPPVGGVPSPAPMQIQQSTSGGPAPPIPPHDPPRSGTPAIPGFLLPPGTPTGVQPITSTPLAHTRPLSTTTPLPLPTPRQPQPLIEDPPDHPPTLQLPILSLSALSLAIFGIEANIFSSDPARKAVGAGWIIFAFVDILWIAYFCGASGGVVRRVLDVDAGGGGMGEVRDSKFTPPYPRNRLSKPPPANYTPRRSPLTPSSSSPSPFATYAPPHNDKHKKEPKWKFRVALSDVQGTFTPMTTLPLRIRRGLSRRKERPTSSPIPVVVGSPAAAGYDLGTREGEGSEREFHSPRRSGENQGQDITDRAGATSPLSQSQTSTASGSAGRKGRRVSPPALPPDFSLQSQLQSQGVGAGTGTLQSQLSITPPEGERRLSVVPEIPSVGSPTPDGMRTAPSTVAHSPSAAPSTGAGAGKSEAGGSGSRVSLTGTGPRNRISNPTDPEMVQRRSAGVWGGVVDPSSISPPSPSGNGNEGKEKEGKGGKEKEKKNEKQPTLVLQNKVMAQAMYTYEGSEEDPNELSFKKGDILEILDSSGKWWDARKADGVVGVVPSNYVRLLS